MNGPMPFKKPMGCTGGKFKQDSIYRVRTDSSPFPDNLDASIRDPEKRNSAKVPGIFIRQVQSGLKNAEGTEVVW